jgi:hypothetical protein
MNDAELRFELEAMGIGDESCRVLALLPLVEVAWADGTVQRAERALILDAATKYGFLHGDGQALLEGWLKKRPTVEYFARGRRALVELVRRQYGAAADFDSATLDGVVALCQKVASAAGGWMGVAFTVEDDEKRAIAHIAEILHIERGTRWGDVLSELQATPAPVPDRR